MQTKMHECSCTNFPLVHFNTACSSFKQRYTWQQMNVSYMHTLVLIISISILIHHLSFMRTQTMLQVFSETCRLMQLSHAYVVKFKSSCTACIIVFCFFVFVITYRQVVIVLFHCIGIPVDNTSTGRSTSSWIIIGVGVGVIILIASIVIILCIILVRRRKLRNEAL